MTFVYGKLVGDQLHASLGALENDRLLREAGLRASQFGASVRNRSFSCIGAKHAIRNDGFWFALLPRMDRDVCVHDLSACLNQYGSETEFGGEFRTLLVAFSGPVISSEVHFENLLWRLLQQLHDIDASHWDRSVSNDPSSVDFQFSFASIAYFIVGLNPASSRLARQSVLPAMAFNLQRQFDELEASGRLASWNSTIRKRELDLQGSINPNLSDSGSFGTTQSARLYSGRRVPVDWVPNFETHERSCPPDAGPEAPIS